MITHYILFLSAIPYFEKEPEIENRAEGETATFYCEAGGRPPPKQYWIYNGMPIEEAPYNPRRIVEPNRIIIKNLTKADTGNYGCNATNVHGYVYKDVYVNVLGKYKLPLEIMILDTAFNSYAFWYFLLTYIL